MTCRLTITSYPIKLHQKKKRKPRKNEREREREGGVVRVAKPLPLATGSDSVTPKGH
jgi:hypothetical protein